MPFFTKKTTSILTVLFVTIGVTATVFLSQRNQDIRQHAAGPACNPTGVTKNQDGTYTFATLHVDSQGNIVDDNNCVIHLVGFNRGWMDSDNVDIDHAASLAQWKAVMPFNVVRIAINSVWYNQDLPAPGFPQPNDMKSLLKKFVQLEESYGNYVELDIDQQYAHPPCLAGGGGHCYPQGQADTDFANEPAYCQVPYAQEVQQNLFADPNCVGDVEEVAYQPPALTALTDLAKTYGSDPAVIFDVWNEPLDANLEKMTYTDFRPAMDKRIQTVRQYTNNLIEVFTAWIQNLPQDPYTETNLVMDYHNYHSDFTGKELLTYIPFFHSHGQAVIINEYGGTTYSATVQNTIKTLGINDSVSSLYFGGEHLVTKNPFALNQWGQWVASDATAIFGSLGITPTISQAPSLTPTGKITPSITITSTLTPTINPQDSRIALTICPHGLGHCGDNANPKGQGTQAPQHITKTVTLTLFDTHNTQVGQPVTTTVSYVPASENFQGIADLGVLPTGDYLLSIKSEGYLGKQLNQIIHLSTGQTTALPEVFLVTGDINNDNQVDIQDYNALINCYGTKQSSQSCLFPPTKQAAGADILDDDGQVDAGDYNEFLRELSVQQGQ